MTTVELIDPSREQRIRDVGMAIQTSVAARPDVAVSPVGMGLDMLSSLMMRDPEQAAELGIWLTFAAGLFAYIDNGEPNDATDALFAGRFLSGDDAED